MNVKRLLPFLLPLLFLALHLHFRLRSRERRAQVRWLAKGDEVPRLLSSIAGEYRLSRREALHTWFGLGLLSFVLGLAYCALLSGDFTARRTSALEDFERMRSSPAAIAFGVLVFGAGLLETYSATQLTLRIRPECVEELSGMPFGS